MTRIRIGDWPRGAQYVVRCNKLVWYLFENQQKAYDTTSVLCLTQQE